MTDPAENHPNRAALRAIWLAFAAPVSIAAASLCAVPAAAAEEGSSSASRPRDGIGPQAEDAGRTVSLERRLNRELADAADGVPPPPPPEPGVARFADTGLELYGPPAPKVSKGELAEIGWTTAGPEVPPALEVAINLVTRNYPTALSSRAALRAAHSDVRSAQWQRFPTVTGNVGYFDSGSGAEPQLVIETPLWAGGRIDATIGRARASEDVSSATYVLTVQELARQTADTYFQIVLLTQSEQLLAESVKIHQQLVETMERRVKQEVSPQADLELARSRAAQIQQQYTVTRSQRTTALRVLAELVADPDYDLGPVPYYDPEQDMDNRDQLEAQAVAFDPSLRRFQAQVDVARQELDQRKASILPQLNAQYAYDELRGSRFGLVVRAQATGGLSQISDVNSARLRIQTVQETARAAEQQLRRDMASDIIQYEASKTRAVISRDATDTAARVSESYMRQFIAGRRSWLDVMNALREAVSAQLGKAEAEVTVMNTATRMLLRSGRWRPVFEGVPESRRDSDKQSED